MISPENTVHPMYKKGVDDVVEELKQICKDFSDLRNRPYMGDVYSSIDSIRDRVLEGGPSS